MREVRSGIYTIRPDSSCMLAAPTTFPDRIQYVYWDHTHQRADRIVCHQEEQVACISSCKSARAHNNHCHHLIVTRPTSVYRLSAISKRGNSSCQLPLDCTCTQKSSSSSNCHLTLGCHQEQHVARANSPTDCTCTCIYNDQLIIFIIVLRTWLLLGAAGILRQHLTCFVFCFCFIFAQPLAVTYDLQYDEGGHFTE